MKCWRGTCRFLSRDIEIAKMDDDKGPTYKVHAYDADGKEILPAISPSRR